MSNGKTGKHKPRCAVITVRDPDDEPVALFGQEGGMLEIRTEARNYDFEVVLVTANGSPVSGPEPGSRTKPVVFPIPSAGQYVVKETHHKKGSSPPSPPPPSPPPPSPPPPADIILFNVHPCPGC